MSQHSSWAMLSDMVVPGCEGGLVPNFQIDVFDYHCLLKSDVGNMQVIPKVMWMPGFNQQMEIHVQGKVWKSGHVFVQPLKDRKAEVDVVVHAADKIHQAVYRIAAHAQRITEHTTSLRPSTSETPRPTTTALTPTAPKIWKPKKRDPKPRPSSNGGEEPPRGRTWALPRLRLPGLPKPSWRESARWTGIVAASFSFAALLQQHELWSFMCLLKELQFAGISGELAGADTFYAQMVRPFRVFLLQVTLPLDICSSKGGGCEPLQEWRECKASNVVLWLLLLPPLLMLLLLGWWEAASEETLSRHGLLKGIGVRGLRRKLLPMVLVALDIGLMGFADAIVVQLQEGDTLKVNAWEIPIFVWRWLYLVYPVGFGLFSLLQLARLWQRFLVWSPTLSCFADKNVLGVTLRRSRYSRTAANPLAALAEACDRLTELRVAVPICGPDREIVRLGGPPAPQGRTGCLCAVLTTEEATSARERVLRAPVDATSMSSFSTSVWTPLDASQGPRPKLLAEGSDWQLQRERLGLLFWMERRSIVYEALKVQINEASGHGVITDAQGWPIYDCRGLSLRDLYQYCVYEFPWRPWLVDDGKAPGCSPLSVLEAYGKGVGIVAPWVPAIGGMQDLERQQINDWLSDWLVEAEAASSAREELRQLRWYAQELQDAVLREMALAVLEHRDFRAVSGTASEIAQSQARLEEATKRRLVHPWQQQVDGLGSHEILAFVHEELLDSEEMPFYDEELAPDFMNSVFGVVRFHVRAVGENPLASLAPSRRWLRTPGESLSPRRPPALRVTHQVRLPQVRSALVTLQLPLKHLALLSWLPAFGFAASSLALPVAERWQPLFHSAALCCFCRHRPSAQSAAAPAAKFDPGIMALFSDAAERLFLLLAIWGVHASQENLEVRLGLRSLPRLALLSVPLFAVLWRCMVFARNGRSARALPIGPFGPFALLFGRPAELRSETLGRGEPKGRLTLPPGLPLVELSLGIFLCLEDLHESLSLLSPLIFACLLILSRSFFRALAVIHIGFKGFFETEDMVYSRHSSECSCIIHLSTSGVCKLLTNLFGSCSPNLFSSVEWHRPRHLQVLRTSSEREEEDPTPLEFGIFEAVDGQSHSVSSERQALRESPGITQRTCDANQEQRLHALDLIFFCKELGLALRALQSEEFGGASLEGPSSNERQMAGLRKRFAVFRPFDTSPVFESIIPLRRVKEIRDVIPVAATRAQMVGAEELPEMVATIHVVNHCDSEWSRIENDSILSLFLPWGLDSRQPAKTSQPSRLTESRSANWREWRNQTVESSTLIETWKSDVLSWLDDELAVGWVEDGILDLIFFAGNPSRGAFKEELDKLLSPGIFSDDCLGQSRFSESRCYRDGRVLHYVITSQTLKTSSPWRPDPLGAHAASLFVDQVDDEEQGFEESWSPCLLRLSSREVIYLLREDEGTSCGDGVAEIHVPFVALEKISIDVTSEVCFLTLHASRSDRRKSEEENELLQKEIEQRERERRQTTRMKNEEGTRKTVSRGSSETNEGRIQLKEDLKDDTRVQRHNVDKNENRWKLPLIFRMRKTDGAVWAKVIEEYQMFKPRVNIANYIGEVADHPRLPGIVFRTGPNGDQLWPDGTRFIGSWQEHTYHGHGQLLDQDGQLIYKGQWSQGMKHGEGLYYFYQEPSGSRVYSGQFCREEFSGRGCLWVEDGSLDWLRKNRPWAIVRYEGYFSGAGQLVPRSLLTLDERHAAAVQEHFPLSSDDGLAFKPLQASGRPPKDHAAEFYSLDGADLQHCGPDEEAEVWYANGSRYCGPCLAGAVPHGHGKFWEEDLCFEGQFDRGLRAPGVGRVSLRNGVVYEGEFLDGRRHGHGTTEIPEALQQRLGFKTHVGQYKDGLRHGPGEMVFADGAVYRGDFEKNGRHGKGLYRNSVGIPIFDGPWSSDEPGTGAADVLYSSGHRYKGHVQSGAREGEGTLWRDSLDGSNLIYTGQWKADEFHGDGELHCPDGLYRGQFANGVREGEGRFEYSRDTSSYYQGQWKEDQPHGIGTCVDQHGEYADREFEEGELSRRYFSRSRSVFKVKHTLPAMSVKVEPGPQGLPRSSVIGGLLGEDSLQS
ncbi:unnamed protein product [Durusdinium trenchii]|uniref:Uncharacterized protein n=1 Tax=Durusdinium trenchii TaxID=1381693 RepID=A0ABP0MCL4_9DINO